MKIIVQLVLLFTSLTSLAQSEIKWMSFDEAIKAQEKEPRKLIMDVYTTWCGPCKMLDKYTFHNEDVVNYINKNYYAAKFNAEGNDKINFKGRTFENPGYDSSQSSSRNSTHEFSNFLNVSGYPTVLFFDEKAKLLLPLVGVYPPNDIEFFLKLIATDKYKELSTKRELEDYKENFVSTFSN